MRLGALKVARALVLVGELFLLPLVGFAVVKTVLAVTHADACCAKK